MNKDFFENLRVVARVGGGKISKQNLALLKAKYNITDGNMNEVSEYCNSYGIHIFDEEAMEICEKKDPSVEQVVSIGLSEEYKIRLKKARIISDFIMHLASVKARKRVNGKGWLCGTYANRICERLERNVIRKFDESEMDYIIEHLPPENDEDINFRMVDEDNPQLSIYYNEVLNNMIP